MSTSKSDNDVDNTDSIDDELRPTTDAVLLKGTYKLRQLQKIKVAKEQPFFTEVTRHLAEQINLTSGGSIQVVDPDIISQINKAGLKNVVAWLNKHEYCVVATERRDTIVHIKISAVKDGAYFKLLYVQ